MDTSKLFLILGILFILPQKSQGISRSFSPIVTKISTAEGYITSKPFDIAVEGEPEATLSCKIDKSKDSLKNQSQKIQEASDRLLWIAQHAPTEPNTHRRRTNNNLRTLAMGSITELYELSAIGKRALYCQQDAYDLETLTECQEELTKSIRPILSVIANRKGSYTLDLIHRKKNVFEVLRRQSVFDIEKRYQTINMRIIKQCS